MGPTKCICSSEWRVDVTLHRQCHKQMKWRNGTLEAKSEFPPTGHGSIIVDVRHTKDQSMEWTPTTTSFGHSIRKLRQILST